MVSLVGADQLRLPSGEQIETQARAKQRPAASCSACEAASTRSTMLKRSEVTPISQTRYGSQFRLPTPNRTNFVSRTYSPRHPHLSQENSRNHDRTILRIHHRPLQNRDDPSTRALAWSRGHRVRHPRVGALVQHATIPGADRVRYAVLYVVFAFPSHMRQAFPFVHAGSPFGGPRGSSRRGNLVHVGSLEALRVTPPEAADLVAD